MIKRHAISIDVEDWYHSGHLKEFAPKSNQVKRISFTIDQILDLFEANNVIATFFVLGEIARENPTLINKIYSKGHEIASHGYSHTPLWHLSHLKAQEEISTTNKILSDIIGKEIKGYRAPHYSLDEKTSWLIDILEEEGFDYDSSIFPVKTPLHGINGANLSPYYICKSNLLNNTSTAKIIEFPLTVYKLGFLKIPCTGGIYGRYIPQWMLSLMLKNIAKDRLVNFYFHPWEIDKEIPQINVPFKNKMVAYYNVDSYLEKIESILNLMSWTSFENIKSELTI
jgi:polysaccharide deacetylase family protein (PEP-CTERM system associated)